MNGDGLLDIVVVNWEYSDVTVLTGRCDGTFHPAVFFGADARPTALGLGDLNADGSRVIGRFQASLPRKSPGKQGSPEVKRAAELYQRLYVSQDKEGNWHEIANIRRLYWAMPIYQWRYRSFGVIN